VEITFSVNYENKDSASTTIGLAQLVRNGERDPQAIVMIGAIAVGGIHDETY
jgi:hypothetical protein